MVFLTIHISMVTNNWILKIIPLYWKSPSQEICSRYHLLNQSITKDTDEKVIRDEKCILLTSFPYLKGIFVQR